MAIDELSSLRYTVTSASNMQLNQHLQEVYNMATTKPAEKTAGQEIDVKKMIDDLLSRRRGLLTST